ncbi:MAG: hypothetical protein AB9842_08520 [Bacteroidales bacterium]
MDFTISFITGIATSLIVVMIVSLYSYSRAKLIKRKLRLVLGFSESKCVISTSVHETDNWGGFIHHQDAYAFTYLTHLALNLNVNPDIIPFHKIPESADPVDEFCVGGPLSNLRTEVLLRKYYPDFDVKLAAGPSPGTYKASFKIAGKEVAIENNEEYSFLVKIRTDYSKIVHLLFGITPLGTAGAAYYLYKYYRDIYKLYGQSPYFIILKSDLSLGFKTAQMLTEFKDIVKPVK